MDPAISVQVRISLFYFVIMVLTCCLVFSSEPPFDRHDWIVRRPQTGEEVRYVIDYYSAPPEPDGSPVFSLDVRPALDSFGSMKQRIAVATEEVWANFRDEKKVGTPRHD